MTGLSALIGALGLVGVLFALLSFVLAIFGAPSDLAWIWGNFGIGLALLVTAVALNFDALRERLSSGEARRASKYGTSAILTTALSIAILGMLGFLAERYSMRFDWSEQKIHSLTDQTRKVLDGLDRDVQAVAFFPRLDTQRVRDLLDRYVHASDRFHVEYVDPNERPDLLERHGVDPEKLGQGLVRISFGDESVEVQEVTEEKVTNAMVKLSRTAQKKVYFLEGHNERAIEGETAGDKLGYSRAADALRNENYQVEKLLLAAKGEVPGDADVVIVAGATRPLLEQEHDALARYLGRGGSLYALIDPRAHTDLTADLVRWGVELGEDIIVDRQLALFGRATTPFAGKYDPIHEITKDLRETTLFHVARSVRPRGDAAADFTEIVFTGESSWAERDLETFFDEGRAELGEKDLAGPVPIAVAGAPRLAGDGPPGATGAAEAAGAAEEAGAAGGAEAGGASAKDGARLVVFGDSDFASNELIEAYRNRDLFVNTVNWLLGDVEAISIRPKLARASRFQLTTQQFMTIRSLSLFVLPEALAVLGVLTWWTRRQGPAD